MGEICYKFQISGEVTVNFQTSRVFCVLTLNFRGGQCNLLNNDILTNLIFLTRSFRGRLINNEYGFHSGLCKDLQSSSMFMLCIKLLACNHTSSLRLLTNISRHTRAPSNLFGFPCSHKQPVTGEQLFGYIDILFNSVSFIIGC